MKDDIVQAALERLYQMQCDMLSDIETVASALEQPEQVDVLAEYTGDGTHRQWVSTGAWLMPGERVLHAGAGYSPRCHNCASLEAQNTELDRTLCEMEHALNEADAIMEEVSEETADAWRKRWGHLWGRKV